MWHRAQCSGMKWCHSQRGGRCCGAVRQALLGTDSRQVSHASDRNCWRRSAENWAEGWEDSSQNCPKHGGTWWKSGRIVCLREAQDPCALRLGRLCVSSVPPLEAVTPFHWDEKVIRNSWKTGDFVRGPKIPHTVSTAGASAPLNGTVSVR